jgi:hypothetical protein
MYSDYRAENWGSMIRVSQLCEQLEILNSQMFDLVRLELDNSSPAARARSLLGRLSPAASARRWRSLAALQQQMLVTVRQMGEVLDNSGIQAVEEYVSALAASRQRCEARGLTLARMRENVHGRSHSRN